MEDCKRILVALLSMHRCGSSLTAHALQRLGMSLGPFELLGAGPGNPYGHFEAVPFHRLNRQIQGLVYGFSEDLPESPEILTQFCQTRGTWDESIHVPDELVSEGRSLVRTLIDSGRVSGFKDPRTVLTWPFWERVLTDFPDVRVIPLGLIRSPHEIAMSLVTRREGRPGYWASLDVINVHFHRQKQILESQEQVIPSVCFGSPTYLKTLEIVVREIGLTWDAIAVLELFDRSAMHQRPAAVAHQAQRLFESMCGDESRCQDAETSRARLEHDARLLESLRLDQWKSSEEQVARLQEEAGRLADSTRDQERALVEARDRVVEAQGRAADAQNRLSQAESSLYRLQSQLIESEGKLIELQARELQRLDREIEAWRRTDQLRTRLDKYESHPLLGPALRGRRRLRRLIHSVGEGLSAERNGSE